MTATSEAVGLPRPTAADRPSDRTLKGTHAVVTHSGPERRPDAIEQPPKALSPSAASHNVPNENVPVVNTVRRRVEIVNALGFHLRPADRFVRTSNRFQAEITLRVHDRVANGKSILDLMTMAAERGTWIELEARGPDAEAALDALAKLVAARFHEDDEGNAVEVTAP